MLFKQLKFEASQNTVVSVDCRRYFSAIQNRKDCGSIFNIHRSQLSYAAGSNTSHLAVCGKNRIQKKVIIENEYFK